MKPLLSPSVRIGIELGERILRVAWVGQRRGGTAQWHYRECVDRDDPAGASPSSDLLACIRPLHRYQRSARILLTAPNSIVRSLTVRVADERQLAAAVQEQLPTLLPFEVERAHIHFVIEREEPRDGQIEYTLYLAACERSVLQQELERLWRCGWAASGVVPSALALVEAARALHVIDRQPLVLIDVGERRTTMVLIEEGRVVYARDVSLGDEHLTDALMAHVTSGSQTLSLSRDEAHALKQSVGIPDLSTTAEPREPSSIASPTLPLATYLALLQPILEQLVSEVRRTMAFGAHVSSSAVPQRAIVSGPGAQLPHCTSWLSRQLGVPVTRLDCTPLLGAEGSSAALACGLAAFERAPRLDLLPRSWHQRRDLVGTLSLISRVCLAAAIFLWVGVGWRHLRHRAVARQLSTLEARWTELQPVVVLKEQVDVQSQLIQRLMSEQGIPASWFRRLTHEFPNPIHLTQLTVDTVKHEVGLRGEAQEREQSLEAHISEFALWVEQAHLCRSVQLGSTHRTSANGNIVEFSLACRLP